MSEETVTYTRTADKPKNWHSRRHADPAPHDQARVDYQAAHGQRARQLRALENLRKRLTRYIALSLNGGKPRRGKRNVESSYVPEDLGKATDKTRDEIKTLEAKLKIKAKVNVEVTDGDESED